MKTQATFCLFAATLLLLADRAAGAPPAITPSSLHPCAFTGAELQLAIGMKVDKGEAADMTFPGGRDVGCSYAIRGGDLVFSVRQTWEAPAKKAGAAAPQRAERGLRPPLKGDPDGASWKFPVMGAAGDVSSLELVYTRGSVRTRLILHGGNFTVANMQPKLLALRRVP